MPGVRQQDMQKIPVPPGSRARLEAIRRQYVEATGRLGFTLAETIERIVDAHEQADRYRKELAEIDQVLKDAGITYPPGVRGVRDLAGQRDKFLSELQERG